MITYTGVHIQKIGGECGTPTATDIAVHAGRICRFGGAVWYPLLPHLVFVGLMAYRRSESVPNLLWGFLHDAHEIATSDVPRPFKCDCMRREQEAIDDRIFEKFFAGEEDPDWKLVKECDIDAAHIEAVQLGVPGFAETELKYATDYTGRDSIHDDAEDVALFNRIMNSSFGHWATIYPASLAVKMFTDALTFAERGEYKAFLKEVESWRLLHV